MIAENIGFTLEKVTEVPLTANEVAELGAVKPRGFGSLIKRRALSKLEKPQDELNLPDILRHIPQINHFGIQDTDKTLYHCMCQQEVSRECSEYLCDYGIMPQTWLEAALEQRIDMVKTATKIMANELKLPVEWIGEMEPVTVSGKNYIAEASCRIKPLNNGGIAILDVLALKVNTDRLQSNYFEVMAALYHEMIHVKQYASVDGLIPERTTDVRLLDLIHAIRASDGYFSSNASFLDSIYEADALTQALYFKKNLQTIVQARSL